MTPRGSPRSRDASGCPPRAELERHGRCLRIRLVVLARERIVDPVRDRAVLPAPQCTCSMAPSRAWTMSRPRPAFTLSTPGAAVDQVRARASHRRSLSAPPTRRSAVRAGAQPQPIREEPVDAGAAVQGVRPGPAEQRVDFSGPPASDVVPAARHRSGRCRSRPAPGRGRFGHPSRTTARASRRGRMSHEEYRRSGLARLQPGPGLDPCGVLDRVVRPIVILRRSPRGPP